MTRFRILRLSLPAIIALALWVTSVAAQEPPTAYAENAIFLEVHTDSTPFAASYDRVSINYERLLTPEVGAAIGFSIDIGNQCKYTPPVPNYCYWRVLRMPVTLNRLWGAEAHRFETGAGVMFTYQAAAAEEARDPETFQWSLPVRLGYRYHPPAGGVMFTGTFVPQLFGRTGGQRWYFAIGIGYGF